MKVLFGNIYFEGKITHFIIFFTADRPLFAGKSDQIVA